MNTTLVTKVKVTDEKGTFDRRDVFVEVVPARLRHTAITFVLSPASRVEVLLTEGERIAFIEALGGHA